MSYKWCRFNCDCQSRSLRGKPLGNGKCSRKNGPLLMRAGTNGSSTRLWTEGKEWLIKIIKLIGWFSWLNLSKRLTIWYHNLSKNSQSATMLEIHDILKVIIYCRYIDIPTTAYLSLRYNNSNKWCPWICKNLVGYVIFRLITENGGTHQQQVLFLIIQNYWLHIMA